MAVAACVNPDWMGSAQQVPQILSDYFKGPGVSLQEYFQFPEMKKIRNPVHEYFRLTGEAASCKDWIQEGTLAIEESEDGWVVLGAEHQELARIAVGKSRDRNYYAYAWDGYYIGPMLRATTAVLRSSAHVALGAAGVASTVVGSAASLVYRPLPWVPPADSPLLDRFVEESVEVDGETWWFRVWLPPDLEAVRKDQGSVPAFLLLHGFKECGWDNWCQTNGGLPLHLQCRGWSRWLPGIVVLPQLPRRPWEEQWWEHWRTPAMQRMALACLERAVAKYRVDRKRLYLLGESLGTEGAWFLAAAKPGLFAAVAGSCGSVEPYDWVNWAWGQASEGAYQRLAEGIGRGTPIWFCHGANDDFVPVEQSRRFHAALQQNRSGSALASVLRRVEPAEVIYQEYKDLDHHVWDHAYEQGGLLEWLLSQRQP